MKQWHCAARRVRGVLVAGSALLALGGCATFSKDGGFDAVDSAVRARTGAQPRWAKSEEEAKTLAAEVA
ncbi:MAG TPA: RND transporter, partial [Burkholderiales bacterium]|nr:RND transporter [Burkholderiales bacterium]